MLIFICVIMMVYMIGVYIMRDITMLRTQIYLTKSEKESLLALSIETGLHQSALIREAIDQFIQKKRHTTRKKKDALESAAGMWAECHDLPDLRNLRTEFDRE